MNDLSSLVSPLRQAGGTQQSHDATVIPLSQVVHPLVACDVCDRPIVGVRYKCGSADTDVLLNFCSSFGATFSKPLRTRSQAVARIADRTASQQTLVHISNALPMKLHAVNSTSFRLLYRSTIRINTALIFAAPSQSLKNITLSPFRKLVRPVVPSDIPGDQYFEYVTANSIFILFLQISLTRVVIK